MNNYYHTIIVGIASTLLLFNSCSNKPRLSEEQFNTIVTDFQTPADNNNVWCYWYWIGDDVSKEGITKDLEAMKKAGIGTAFIGNINPDEIDGKVPMLSEEWWDCMVHAVNEGKRIGVDIGSFNCPGWSQSGGPWIKSDMAMRYVNYTETKVTGPKKISLNLVKPRDEFQDLYVLAFPAIKAEKNKLTALNSKITISPKIKNAKYLLDDNPSTAVEFSKDETSYSIDIKIENAIEARSIIIFPGKENIKMECELFAFTGGEYVPVKTFTFDRSNNDVSVGPEKFAPLAVSIPVTNSKEFKLEISEFTSLSSKFGISEIAISEAVVLEKYVEKHLGKMHPTPLPEWDTYSWEPQTEIENSELKLTSKNIIDISSSMDSNGKWQTYMGSS